MNGDSATIALLFPGQGSQTDDMRETVASERPDLLALAAEIVGCDPFDRVDEGTRFAQPALYCASLACLAQRGNPAAQYMTGHSLGEIPALVAAGVIDERDGLRVVARRGALMQEAGERAGDGSMLALLGAEAAELADEIAAEHGLAVANYNAPGQVVLSGARGALPGAAEAARERGLKSMQLPVTGAFHSPAMAAAKPSLRTLLDDVELRPARATVFSCASAAPFADVRTELVDALTRPVRFSDTVLALRARGVQDFVEVGPGRVLSGLVKRILRAERTVA